MDGRRMWTPSLWGHPIRQVSFVCHHVYIDVHMYHSLCSLLTVFCCLCVCVCTNCITQKTQGVITPFYICQPFVSRSKFAGHRAVWDERVLAVREIPWLWEEGRESGRVAHRSHPGNNYSGKPNRRPSPEGPQMRKVLPSGESHN